MRHLILSGAAVSLLLVGATTHAQAQEQHEVEMHWVSKKGVERSIGTVALEEREDGLLLTPDLSGIIPGIYGFHVHQNASCEPGENDDGETIAAGKAGGHYDPKNTGSHEGPYGEGHRGDLPVLTVNEDGKAMHPVLAPRLSLDDMQGRSLMIHAEGDTYSNEPKDGGGGPRKACGVVELTSS
ncbi:superoxide dismutase family protein [Vreelandella rituensis]|uniref:Superoxide dismutase [Cu-Zn] n=1 Tax=Vreelandella rituensis TaxID=2282306 RepID=A0A368TT50_9GAMM|nr:superoxide dismutase family protein [Halomonas rituensis]RCV87864.1 superoxide dismutase [Halomonas rituensis]